MSDGRRAPLSALRRFRPSPEVTNAVITIVGIAAAAWMVLSLFAFQASPGWGYDFEAYLLAADRLARGASAYLAWTLAGPFRPGPYGLYLYAPPLAVALIPMSLLSVPAATTTWFLIRAFLLIAAVALMPLRRQTRLIVLIVAAFSEATLVDLNLGNVSLIVLFLSVVAWRFLDRPLGAAAIAIAISVRPPFAIFLAWWLVRRRWRALVACLATGLAIVLLTLPVVGVASYTDYLALLRNLSDVTGVPNNADFGSSLSHLGVPTVVSSGALLIGYLVALAAIGVSLRRDAEVSFLVTLGATLLLSPLLWDHYLVIVLPAIGFLLERRWWAGVALALITLLWMPAWIAPLVAIGATLGPFLARPPQPVQPTADTGADAGEGYELGSSSLSVSPT